MNVQSGYEVVSYTDDDGEPRVWLIPPVYHEFNISIDSLTKRSFVAFDLVLAIEMLIDGEDPSSVADYLFDLYRSK